MADPFVRTDVRQFLDHLESFNRPGHNGHDDQQFVLNFVYWLSRLI